MSVTEHAQIGYWQLLQDNPSIRRLWLAQVVSELGDWLNFVALVQIIDKFSTSAQASGWVIIIQMTAMTLFSPFAGVVADRFDRRHIMIITDLVRAVIVLGYLTIDGADKLPLLYLLVALHFSLTAFFEPARAALLPNLIKDEQMVAAYALTSVTWSSMLAIGGLLGGLITGLLSSTAAFFIDATTFLLSALIIYSLKSEKPLLASHKKDAQAGGLMVALRYLRAKPAVLAILLVKSGICITAGSILLLSVVYGQRVFPIADGAISVGLLYGAHGLGSVLGASFTARFFATYHIKPVRNILWAFLWRSACFALWGAATNIGWASLAIMGVTASGSMLWVISSTLMQQLTRDEIRGRLFAIENALLTLAVTISIALTGRAIDVWGMSASLTTVSAAVVALVVAMAWVWVVVNWQKWAAKVES